MPVERICSPSAQVLLQLPTRVYNLVMKSARYCLLLLAWSLTGQTPSEDPPTSRLTSTLMTLKGARSTPSIRQQIVDDVMLMAWKNNQPSWTTVGKFADDLMNALAGRDL